MVYSSRGEIMKLPAATNTSGTIKWFFLAVLFTPIVFITPLYAGDSSSAQQLIQDQCSSCHKFAGQYESKFNLKAPDLMWGGNKYQRPWLIRWLTGKEENLYPNGYRWDLAREQIKHPVLSEPDANQVADYFEKHLLDSRIKKSFVNLSTLSEMEAGFGAKIFKDYSCLGCHQIKEDGKIEIWCCRRSKLQAAATAPI